MNKTQYAAICKKADAARLNRSTRDRLIDMLSYIRDQDYPRASSQFNAMLMEGGKQCAEEMCIGAIAKLDKEFEVMA